MSIPNPHFSFCQKSVAKVIRQNFRDLAGELFFQLTAGGNVKILLLSVLVGAANYGWAGVDAHSVDTPANQYVAQKNPHLNIVAKERNLCPSRANLFPLFFACSTCLAIAFFPII